MVTGGGGGGAGGRRENPGSRRSFSIFNTFSFHPTPERGFRWPYTLHGRGWAAAANAAPPAAAGVLAALPAGCGGGGAGWAAAQDSGRLSWALPGGERALPETVLRRCSLPSVPLSVCLSPRVDLVPAVWRLILLVNFALFGLSTRGDWSLTCVSSRGYCYVCLLADAGQLSAFILIMRACFAVCACK